jgi:hypothetical protein
LAVEAYEGLWDVKRAADYLGITATALYKFCKRGLVPHIRLAQQGAKRPRLRFVPHEVCAWAAGQRAPASSVAPVDQGRAS